MALALGWVNATHASVDHGGAAGLVLGVDVMLIEGNSVLSWLRGDAYLMTGLFSKDGSSD